MVMDSTVQISQNGGPAQAPGVFAVLQHGLVGVQVPALGQSSTSLRIKASEEESERQHVKDGQQRDEDQ